MSRSSLWGGGGGGGGGRGGGGGGGGGGWGWAQVEKYSILDKAFSCCWAVNYLAFSGVELTQFNLFRKKQFLLIMNHNSRCRFYKA